MKTKLLLIISVLIPMFVLPQGLTIGEDTYVSVSNGLYLRVLDGDLKILATADGMGSLLVDDDANNTITVSGTGAETIVQSYIVADKWHYVSSPLTDAVSFTFYEMWLKPFVESTHDWGDYILPTDVELIPGKGYALYSFSSGTPNPGTKSVEYTSTTSEALNSGTVSPTVAYTDAQHGYNLVGNPYTSAIDWNATSGWTRTNIGNTIYIWNGTEEQYGSYVKDAGTGTYGVSNIIIPGQGFFALATASSPVLSMDNNVRVHAGSSQTILKSNWSWFKLGVEETDEQWGDEVLIDFRPDGSSTFNEFDAKKWFSPTEEVPDLFLKKSEHSLASSALGNFDDEMILPLHFQAGTAGNIFKMHLKDVSSDPDMNAIYLRDKVTGIITNLMTIDDYVFTAQSGDDPDRFEISFKEAYGINDVQKDDLVVYYSTGQINIIPTTGISGTGTFNVYNILGQPVFTSDINLSGERFSVNVNLTSGAYMVELITDNQRSTGKVLIN